MTFLFNKRVIPQRPDAASDADLLQGDMDAFDNHRFDEVQATLRLQLERLQILAGSTEGEFLAIGARLQEFYTRTMEIGGDSSLVTDRLSGAETREALSELGNTVERMGAFLNFMHGEADRSSLTLQNTLEMIAGVDEPLSGFKKIMKVLHVLGISTKIESARLGQLGAGFHNLAEDVENLAVQINDKSTRIMSENVSLSCQIRETLVRMSDIETGQREDVRLLLEKTRSSLETISAVHRKCAEVAAAISEASGEVSRNISEVVTSMQFHDITRQQLEHVQEALCDLEQHLAADGDANDDMNPASAEAMAGEIYDVCRLQSAQLIHARDGLALAVSGIVENLRGLADRSRAIARQTREIIRVADGAGDSLLIEIERSLAAVVGLLAKSADANLKLRRAVESVAGTVGKISSFVIDIETVGEEIKLIAMNSQIKAARTGDEGAALGVLAEAIQRLSVDACAQTATVTGTLREITRVTESLSDGVAVETRSGELDVDVMAGRLKGLIDSIRAVNDGVMATLAHSDAAVQELSDDIDNATGGIRIHGAVDVEVEGITAELEQLMALARAITPEAVASDLTTLSGRYTMHSERKIHASVAGSAMAVSAEVAAQDRDAPTTMADEMEESELGDNVELF